LGFITITNLDEFENAELEQNFTPTAFFFIALQVRFSELKCTSKVKIDNTLITSGG